MLRDGVQPPMLWDPVPEAPQPCFRYFSSPYPPPTWRTGGGFSPSATTTVPDLPLFVSNGPGEPLGAKTKIYNLPSFAPPTLRKREPPRSQVFRIRAPIGSCARARQPRPWSRGHRACVGAPPPQTSPKGEERFLGAPALS